MHPYWFTIGPFPVRAYSTIFVLAFLLGFGVTLYFAKADRKEHYVEHFWNLAPWLFLAGVAGARFWQVFFFDWPYYREHPWEIIAIWHGGLSIQGGIAGGLLAGWWYVRRHRLHAWEMLDLAAPGVVLGQSIGRAANLMNGDAFGGPTGGDFGILYPPGSLARRVYGDQPLWPAEVWEGQVDVVIFALLLILKQRKQPAGWLFCLYIILYNGARLFLEELRGDSPRYLFGWTAAQWTSVAAIALAAGLMVYLARRARREPSP
ncbi:MAG: prolipoprotein diacylglyceryl transferase [Alicyclobacillaceae bacterium]|nr:prolipoprotein diacylglyceryl transferase [Alicyclobacillaceae bacterium]